MYINFMIIAEHISSESRLYSQKVRMYVRGGPHSEMSCGMSLHTVSIGIGHMSDILDSDRCVDDGALWRWRWSSGSERGHCGLYTRTTANHRQYTCSILVGGVWAQDQSTHWREARMHMHIPSTAGN